MTVKIIRGHSKTSDVFYWKGRYALPFEFYLECDFPAPDAFGNE